MAESTPSSKDGGCQVDEDDVCKLNLRGVREAMEEMGLSMKGLQSLKEVRLALLKEIIKRKAGRSKGKRKLAGILNKIKEDHKRKCEQLISLLDAIETKIDTVPETDPLWKQLNIICQGYKGIFENQRMELRKTFCKLLVTGETCAGKTTVINNLLGETLLPESFLCNTQSLSEISYGKENHAVAYPWDDGEPLEIVPEEGKDFLEVLKEKIEAREDLSSHGVFKRIEINLNNQFLKESEVTIIDTPGVGDNETTTKMVHEHLQDAFAFLFVINTENRGGVHDRIRDLAGEVKGLKIENSQFFRPESVVFLGNKLDMIPPSDHDRLVADILKKLRQYWPGFKSEQFLPYCAKDAAAVLKEGFMTRPFCELLNRFETLIPVGSDNKLRMNFLWIANMLRKIIYALDVHINNRKKDFQKKKMEFEATITRLSKLQEVTEKDLKAFKRSLNKVVDELVDKLKHFLLDESVLAGLADWDEREFSFVTDWQELEKRLYECLTSRLDSQMRKWDMEKKEFQHAMDKFQQEVVNRVSVIGEELEEAMRQVADQGEQKEMESRAPGETGRGWIRPFLHSMTTFERAFFGYSAVVLFPVTAVIAVSAFIYLSTVKLLDVVRSYFKGHEFEKFRVRPVEYLKKCSETLIREYCKSKKGLRAQVVQMMGPWHEFVDKLTEIVPEQINRDKMMIKTYVSEKNVDAQLNEEYPIRRRSLEAVQKALRHFEMFSLQRMSKDVAMFSLNEVAFDENEKSKICCGFAGDIYQAAVRILPPATADEVSAIIQDGQKMMQANLTSIAEMHRPILQEDQGGNAFLSTSTELEQSFQNSEENADVDEMDHALHGASFSDEGYVSNITDEVFKAFKSAVDSLEKEGERVKEVAACCRQGDDGAKEVTEVETGSVDHGGNGENSVIEVGSCSSDEKAIPSEDEVVTYEVKGAVQDTSGATSSVGERKLQEAPGAVRVEASSTRRQPKILSLMDELRQGQGGPSQRISAATSNHEPEISTLPANFKNVKDSRIVRSVLDRGQSLDVPSSESGVEDICRCCRRQPMVMLGRMGHVSIRCIRQPILERDIYNYLEEERCYSRHQCPNLVKFEGTCISENKVYHKLEPLQCNLRQFILENLWSKPRDVSPSSSPPRDTKSPKVSVPADVPKYNMIKDWLLSILEGLVYLHAQGLTSLDLSLDSIAVDAKNVVKLTNISCPKRIFDMEKLRSMTEVDLRSYRYIALEAFEQNPNQGSCRYTQESDMYALGLLIWEILRGQVVFEADFNDRRSDLKTADKFMEFIRSRRPVLPISELCLLDPDFVNHLIRIQNKCWEFDASQRITSEMCMGLIKTDPRPPPMPVARF